MSTTYFLTWQEALVAGATVCGGKGWNLGRLIHNGFQVPQGGVLSTDAYRLFIAINGLKTQIEELMQRITLNNINETKTELALQQLQTVILSGELPEEIKQELIAALNNAGLLNKALAIRSSASMEDSTNASFAGIHASFLNVHHLDNIFAAIKQCYASMWTAKAIAYRRKQNIKDSESDMAVVIMAMVQATAAGIGFTCDPRTGRSDAMIIHANHGLGESVVSGQIESDEYTVSHKVLRPCIEAKKIGHKQGHTVARLSGGIEFKETLSVEQVLSDERIIILGSLLQRVYESIGEGVQHQDIEWADDGDHFILLQTRPVTSLPQYTYSALKGQPEYWSNANVRDALPMVMSNLNRKVVENLFGTIVATSFLAAGYPLLPGLQQVKFFQGRIYLNASLMQWLYYDAFGIMPREINAATGGHHPEITLPNSEIKQSNTWQRNLRKLKLGLALASFRKKAKLNFVEVREFTSHFLSKDLTNLSDEEIVQAIEEVIDFSIRYAPVVGLTMASLSTTFQMLTDFIEKLIPGKGQALANALLLGMGNITSAEQGYRLVELAKAASSETAVLKFFTAQPFEPLTWQNILPDNSDFKQAFIDFLAEFGHRAVYEGDIFNLRWQEDPSYLLQVIQSMLGTADPQKIKSVQEQKRNAAWQAIKRQTPRHKQLFIRWVVGQAITGTELREISKSELVRLALPIRLLVKEIGLRFYARDILANPSDVFYCSWSELDAILMGNWDGQKLKDLVSERQTVSKDFERLPAPDLIVGQTPQYFNTKLKVTGVAHEGIGVATGRASGQAKLLLHPDEGICLQAGDVLVAPSTDPGWTPLFLKVSALIMETGGFLSHGAVVAREFGIPAVVNIPGIMQIIQDGQKVVVDGDEGKVYLE